MRYFFQAICIFILIAGCNSPQAGSQIVDDAAMNWRANEHPLPFLDTIIEISKSYSTQTSDAVISAKDAEELLYNYFKNKGVIPMKELQTRSTMDSMESVQYDTIYIFRSPNISGALVSYWLGPLDLNGHCVQAQKAIILNTSSGYKITNENFIPTSFIIDSTKETNIYGYEYECGGRGMLRQFKIRLR